MHVAILASEPAKRVVQVLNGTGPPGRPHRDLGTLRCLGKFLAVSAASVPDGGERLPFCAFRRGVIARYALIIKAWRARRDSNPRPAA